MQKKTPLQFVAKVAAVMLLLLMVQGCNSEESPFEMPVDEQNQLPSESVPVPALDNVVLTFTPTPEAMPALEPTNTLVPTDRPLSFVRVNANLRAGPGTNYPILGGRVQGALVKVLAQTEDGTRLLLERGNWIFATLVNVVPPDLPVAMSIPPTPTTEDPGPTLVSTPEPVPIESPQSTEPTPTRAKPAISAANEVRATDRIKSSALSASQTDMCVVRINGNVRCWGDNLTRQLNVPAGQFNAVAAGEYHDCGLRTDGTVSCWGANSSGEAVAPAGLFSAVATGIYHSCGLRADGAIQCWGSNSHGEASAPARQFPAVTAGNEYSCGVRTDGSLQCWGSNSGGQVDVPPGQFRAVSAGFGYACAINTDNTVRCWGQDFEGRTSAPAGLFHTVSTNSGHSCGVRTDGSLQC